MKRDRTKILSRKDLLERSWTDTLIKRHLREPDETKPNPWHRGAAPMRFWSRKRAVAIEAGAAWKADAEKARRRSVAAKAVAATTRAANIARAKKQASRVVVGVPRLGKGRLLRASVAAYNEQQAYLSDRHDPHYATTRSEPKFLERIQVNYLRHERTQYEDLLDTAQWISRQRIGAETMREIYYTAIKTRALEAIAEKYPHLAEECKRQMSRDPVLD